MNPVVALIIANVIWGAAAPLFKFALTNIPPFTLAFIRFAGASILFLPFVLFKKYTITKQDLFDICLGSLFSLGINISFFFLALPKTNSINAPVIASSQPILLFLLATVFLKERKHKNVFRGILISFLGVLLIILSPLLTDRGMSLIQQETALEGNLFLFIATLGAVGHALIHKRVLKTVNFYVVTAVSFLFGSITFIPAMTKELNYFSFSQLNGAGWTGIIFGVFFSSALAFGLFAYGLAHIDAQEIGVFSYIDPVIAVLIAVPLLHEYPTPLFFIGSVLVFVGILVAEKRLHWHPFHKIKAARKI